MSFSLSIVFGCLLSAACGLRALISGIAIMSFFLLDANISISPLLRWIIAIIFGGTLATLFRTGSIMIDGGVPHPLKVVEETFAVGASVASILSLII